VNVVYEMLYHNNNHWGDGNCNKGIKEISENNSRKTFNKSLEKTDVLGISDIMSKCYNL
jgi:hypothetical protein